MPAAAQAAALLGKEKCQVFFKKQKPSSKTYLLHLLRSLTTGFQRQLLGSFGQLQQVAPWV